MKTQYPTVQQLLPIAEKALLSSAETKAIRSEWALSVQNARPQRQIKAIVAATRKALIVGAKEGK